jgi:hypothetical protein
MLGKILLSFNLLVLLPLGLACTTIGLFAATLLWFPRGSFWFPNGSLPVTMWVHLGVAWLG